MSQVTVAEPDQTPDPAPRLELSRVQMNVAAWKARLMGELRGWLAVHEVSLAQASEIEAALGRITLRLIREAEAEAGSAPAVAAAAGAVSGGSAVAAGQAGAGTGGGADGGA